MLSMVADGILARGLGVAVGSLRHDTGTVVAIWESVRSETSVAYRALVEWSAPRLFCDKSPGYASDSRVLAWAEQLFASARYLSTIRHPAACIESWVELMQKHGGATWASLEVRYRNVNQNIIDFLNTICSRRRMSIRYEDLVVDPTATLSAVCSDLLAIPYDAAMADPYASDATKTFEAGAGGMATTDPKLLTHKRASSVAVASGTIDSITPSRPVPDLCSSDTSLVSTPAYFVLAPRTTVSQAHLAGASGQVEEGAGTAAGARRGDEAPRLAERLPLPDVSGICFDRRDGRGRMRVLVQARCVCAWTRRRPGGP